MIGNYCLHCRGGMQGLVYSAKVVINEMQGCSVAEIIYFPRERISKAGNRLMLMLIVRY